MSITIPDKIEIKTAAGQTVAFLSPEADGLKEVWIDEQLDKGTETTLSFYLPYDSDKIMCLNIFHRIYAGDPLREFVVMKPGADGQKKWVKFVAHESDNLLSKSYVTVSNDPLVPLPEEQTVKILSGGSDLDGADAFTPGSAGHALKGILNGTSWTVDTVDVSGTHDLEVDRESRQANVQKINELWGGWLVKDSLLKKMSLRDDTLWRTNRGFQIRYGKNLKGIRRVEDPDIVTKLWCYGKDDLDFKSANVVQSGTAAGGGANTITLAAGASSVYGAYIGATVYLTGGTGSGQNKRIIDYNGSTKVATVDSAWAINPVGASTTYQVKAKFILDFIFAQEIHEGTWQNQDITTQAELLAKGQEVLTKLRQPQYNYYVNMVDVRAEGAASVNGRVLTLAGIMPTVTGSPASNEDFYLGDIVKVVHGDLGVDAEVRIVRRRYNVFQRWRCELELGDPTPRYEKTISDLIQTRKRQYSFQIRLTKAATTLIVADASTSKNYRRADYVVLSTYAQTMINRAIAALGSYGGKIILLEGLFVVDNPILVPSNVIIEGQGYGTVVKFKDGIALSNKGLIENADQVNGNTGIAISRLTLDGNKANRVGNTQIGINFTKVSGLALYKVDIANIYGDGCTVRESSGSRLEGIRVHDSWATGYNFDTFNDSSVIGCVCNSNNDGMVFFRSSRNNIGGNNCFGNTGAGIYVYSASKNNTVSSNSCHQNGGPGIDIFGLSASLVAEGNVIISNTVTDNSKASNALYDGIYVGAYGSRNTIQGNAIKKGSTPTQRYGVNIASVNATGNVVTNNDLRDSGETGSFNDAGTGTVTAAGNQL